MYAYDFRKLERLPSNETQFLKELQTCLGLDGVDGALAFLRLSGICIDLYGTKKYEPLYEKALTIIKNTASQDNLDIFVQEVSLLNEVVTAFLGHRTASGVEDIDQRRHVHALLIAGEAALGASAEFAAGKDVFDIKTRYPFVIAPMNSNGELDFSSDARMAIGKTIDRVAETLGHILKYIVHRGASLDRIATTVKASEMRSARDHIQLYEMWDSILLTIDCWRFMGARIVRKDQSTIEVELLKPEEILAQENSWSRFLSQRTKWAYEIRSFGEGAIQPGIAALPPNGIRTTREEMASAYCYMFFGSDDLGERCLGVPLSEWIRAYALLAEVGTSAIHDRRTLSPLTLPKWMICKTRPEWVNTLVDGGVSEPSAKVILKALEFSLESIDLLDCPLIPMGDTLLALPSILTSIEPAFSLSSNMHRLNANLSFKGDRFEERILKAFIDANIKAAQLEENTGGETYECDVAFAVEDTLFLCELKAYTQPRKVREHMSFQRELEKASKQLDRIALHFASHLTQVRQRLALPPLWKPQRMVKLIICAPMLGQATRVNDCYVVDESSLCTFLQRAAPGFILGRLRINGPFPDYKGDITSDKMLRFLQELPSAKVNSLRFRAVADQLTVGAVQLESTRYVNLIEDIRKLDKDTLRVFANMLDTSEDELSEAVARSIDAGSESE